jgi:sugar-specific transcriptional regulator TrmB
MDPKVLEEIGLTKGEIKVYMALIELGPSTAGAILEKANVQNSVFHFCVNRLIEKGLVSYVKKGKTRIYQAADPENLLSYMKDREKLVEQIIPELKAKQTIAKEKQEVEIFQGIKGIIILLNTLIEDAKQGDEFLGFSADVGDYEKNKEIQKMFERYDAKRRDKGIITKILAPKKLKAIMEKRANLQIKYTDIPVPANTGICNDKMALISWGAKPTGVLIQSKQIVEKQKEFFKALWEKT